MLKEIKEKLARITPGEWQYVSDAVFLIGEYGLLREYICQMYEANEEGERDFTNAEANAEFIANAPKYIKYLLDMLGGTECPSCKEEIDAIRS